jgi:hypothetical protein
MDPVYKYLPRRYAIELAQGRSIFVRTLKYFRDVERHGNERGDAGEGMRLIRGVMNGPPNAFSQGAVEIGEGCSNVVFRNSPIATTYWMDAYAYCMSTVCSQATMARFSGADACVRIDDPGAFFRDIESVLRISGGLSINDREMGRVVYDGRRNYELEHLPNIGPAFMKPGRYAPQHEFRMVWMSAKPIRNLDRPFPCARIAKYCSVVPVPE